MLKIYEPAVEYSNQSSHAHYLKSSYQKCLHSGNVNKTPLLVGKDTGGAEQHPLIGRETN